MALKGEESHLHLPFTGIFTKLLQHRALRIKNRRSGVRNYLLSQRSPIFRRNRKNNSLAFPCWSDAIKGKSEQSWAEQQWVLPRLRKKEGKKERVWAIRRRKQKEKGEGNCSIAAPHKSREKRTFGEDMLLEVLYRTKTRFSAVFSRITAN